MCLCAEYFLFAAVPVVQGGRPAAGRGPVRRDHQRPGRNQTLRRLRGGVYAQLQPGQILPGLRGAGTPEERGGTPAEKIPPVYAFRAVKVHGNQGFFRMVGRQVDKVILFPSKLPRSPKAGTRSNAVPSAGRRLRQTPTGPNTARIVRCRYAGRKRQNASEKDTSCLRI